MAGVRHRGSRCRQFAISAGLSSRRSPRADHRGAGHPPSARGSVSGSI